MKNITFEQFEKDLLKDKKFREAAAKLEPEYQLARSLIATRIKSKWKINGQIRGLIWQTHPNYSKGFGIFCQKRWISCLTIQKTKKVDNVFRFIWVSAIQEYTGF